MELGFTKIGTFYFLNGWGVWRVHSKKNGYQWVIANNKEKIVLKYNYQLLNRINNGNL